MLRYYIGRNSELLVRRSPEGGQCNTLQYSCLRIPYRQILAGYSPTGLQRNISIRLSDWHIHTIPLPKNQHEIQQLGNLQPAFFWKRPLPTQRSQRRTNRKQLFLHSPREWQPTEVMRQEGPVMRPDLRLAFGGLRTEWDWMWETLGRGNQFQAIVTRPTWERQGLSHEGAMFIALCLTVTGYLLFFLMPKQTHLELQSSLRISHQILLLNFMEPITLSEKCPQENKINSWEQNLR